MQTEERVKKLKKGLDDVFANIYLWHQLDPVYQAKVGALINRMKTQPGLLQLADSQKGVATRESRHYSDD